MDWIHHHARSIIFLIVTLVVAGILSTLSLPVALFPTVDFPRVRVNVDSGDRPAEQMVVEVTYKLEEAVRALPGIQSVRSTTSRGSAELSVNFAWGTDTISALLQVQSAINNILPTLPAGTTFNAQRMSPTVFPVIGFSLTSPTRSLTELRDIALYQLRPVLSTVPGTASIGVQGGDIEEFRVTVDPAKLQALNLSLGDVAKAVSAANMLVAVGRVEDHDKLYLSVSDTRFINLNQIASAVVRSGTNGVVLLGDLAKVERSAQPQWISVTADGKKAVLFQVYQQPGGNTVQISTQVKARLEQEKARLPGDVQIKSWYDQSELIMASEQSTRDAVLIGVGLAAVILFLFLRNWKITLIATLAVPAALGATMVLLYVLHLSLNIMTLGGMAAAVGLIIDDAIVVVEHIMRRLHHGEGTEHERVLQASREVAGPLSGSSGATIVIFLPLAFLSGVTGAFFKALSLTMASSLLISYLIAWTVLPILAARFLRPSDAERLERSGGWMERINRGYSRLMDRLLGRAWLVVLGLVPLLFLGYFASQRVQSGFMPLMDEGGFILDYRSAPGTSLAETNRLLAQVEKIIQATPEVDTYSRRTGTGLGGGLSEANSGDFFVRLKPPPRSVIDEVMNEVRTKVLQTVPGLQIETAQLMEDLIGDLTSVPQPIEIKLYSEDQALLEQSARKVQHAIEKVNGVVEVKSGVVLAGDALQIQIDRVKAALEGTDPETITTALNAALSGAVTTSIQQGPKLVGVRVWLPPDTRATLDGIGDLRLRAPDGHLFPLKRVAQLIPVTGQPEIARENMKRMVSVTGRISGRDLGSTVAEIQSQVLSQPGFLPTTVPFELGGLYQQQQIAFHGLAIVLIAAVVLVFLLLLFLYESFKVAFALLAMPLLAVPCVYVGLWLTGTEFNITSNMGMTMIVGIVTEVAIFYFSEFRDGSATAAGANRYIAAGINRMRPIAMTTFAAILALAPLAFGIGQGSAMLQPLAIAIISGLLVQLPLVLIVLPALLRLLRVEKTAPLRI
jgi:CzcA family heavy metal efflux pump